MLSLISAWTNNWGNTGGPGDLRRHRSHYDIAVMSMTKFIVIMEQQPRGDDWILESMSVNYGQKGKHNDQLIIE